MPTLTRRGFVLGTSSILCGPHVVFAKSADKKKGISKAQWMAAVMVSAKASDDPLYLGRFREEMYFLLQPITWKPNPDQAPKFEPVIVPAGFVTDLASIPRMFFSALRPDGVYAYAAIVHDYLYWEQERPREVADEILKMSMIDYAVGNTTILSIYESVRLFGGSAWDSNAKLRALGEKRELKKFPPNARTSWAQWKTRQDVFVP